MAIRLLIADDNAYMRRALSQALRNSGPWEIIEATNGEEAVAKARETRPKLVILDLAMPVMDGIRASRAMSILLPGVPIILHTLHYSRRVEIEAVKAGARKVVAKTDSATIVAAVRELLGMEPGNPVPRNPDLIGFTAVIQEPAVPGLDITLIHPVSGSLAGAETPTKSANSNDRPPLVRPQTGDSGPADQ